jgi:hypothetical protein
MGPDCGVVSGEDSALTGVVALPPGRRSGVLGRPGGILVWPVTVRYLGRGHGRSPVHQPPDGYSALMDAGETHDTRRDRQLYGVVIRSRTLDIQNEGTSPFMGLRCADWPH